MAKEWILNNTMNRFQLNFKRNVGATSESIRKCAPKNLDKWEEYYFREVRTKEHIESLGRKLHVKITEIVTAEIEEITEQDCIDYMIQLVIKRTFDGYITEIQTVYGQLAQELNVKIEPAPDEWDRIYNVDFFINIKNRYIGIQIKPVHQGIQLSQIFKERNLQSKSHNQFTQQFGGKVLYVYSSTVNKKKEIRNPDVIDEIKAEMQRLNKDDD